MTEKQNSLDFKCYIKNEKQIGVDRIKITDRFWLISAIELIAMYVNAECPFRFIQFYQRFYLYLRVFRLMCTDRYHDFAFALVEPDFFFQGKSPARKKSLNFSCVICFLSKLTARDNGDVLSWRFCFVLNLNLSIVRVRIVLPYKLKPKQYQNILVSRICLDAS